MILTDLISMLFRLAELVFGAIVAGITGKYLHDTTGVSAMDNARFIYTEVVAGLSILAAIIWLFPFSGSFIHWPIDLFISVLWFIAFGLIVSYLNGSCGGTFDWGNIGLTGTNCGSWKADEAFAFLSAICWLVSALLGIWWMRKHRNRQVAGTTRTSNVGTSRRRWYRSNRSSRV